MNRGKTKINVVYKIVIALLVATWFLFQFGLTYHQQKGNSMANTIKNNELLWINKMAVGAWFLGMKMPGTRSLNTGDIIYFAQPKDIDKPMYQKTRKTSRIMGKPGDTIEIKHKEIFINHEKAKLPDSAKVTHRVVFKQNVNIDKFTAKYNIDHAKTLVKGMDVYEMSLTQTDLEKIRKNTAIDYVRLLKTYDRQIRNIFPESHYIGWSRDIFGPLVIPGKGDIITFDFKKYSLYKDIIETYENNQVVITKGIVYINGKRANSYTVKNDYYFVIDDNRDHMDDSRKWGFLPENHVLGKVIGKK